MPLARDPLRLRDLEPLIVEVANKYLLEHPWSKSKWVGMRIGLVGHDTDDDAGEVTDWALFVYNSEKDGRQVDLGIRHLRADDMHLRDDQLKDAIDLMIRAGFAAVEHVCS